MEEGRYLKSVSNGGNGTLGRLHSAALRVSLKKIIKYKDYDRKRKI